jgi:hypothetical protein
LISYASEGEVVRVNLGKDPFSFDMQGMIEMEEERKRAKVQHVEVDNTLLQRMVRDYLLYNGYKKTLEALDVACGISPDAYLPFTTGTICREASSMNIHHLPITGSNWTESSSLMALEKAETSGERTSTEPAPASTQIPEFTVRSMQIDLSLQVRMNDCEI